MKKTIFKTMLLLSVTALVYSCYPGDDISISDLDTVTTIYEKSDFDPAPKTAILYWEVDQILSDDDDDLPYDGEVDDEILNTTLDNLVNLYGVENVTIFSTTGESPKPKPNNTNVKIITENDPEPTVDAAVVPSIILRKNTSASIVYPPCYPGYWGWYCYPPIVSVSSYDAGTVILHMMDIRNNKNEIEDASWSAYIRGLLSSNAITNSNRTVSGINQAFNQSPYLN